MLKKFGTLSLAGLLGALSASGCSTAQQTVPQNDHHLLFRHYELGETNHYHMKASNRDRLHTITYEVQANSVVKKDSSGRFFEEFTWSNLVRDGKPATLTPAASNFRQLLSLDPDYPLSVPDLRDVLSLVAPITDLLTIYADLQVAQRGALVHAGDHFYFKYAKPASWADGYYVLVGQDSIDFDVTLGELDAARQVATVIVRHVPPAQPEISLPAEWMRTPVADTANNWVQVSKTSDGNYHAAMGKETFAVQLQINVLNGKILSGTFDNPVEVLERDCTDAALKNCGEGLRYQIRRQIELN